MSFSHRVSKGYDALAHLILELCDSQFFNLGFWDKKNASFAQAQQRLVEVFGEFCGLSKEDVILDVGCGTGEQDFYFADRYGCKKITAINISKIQLEMAFDKLKKAGKKYPSLRFEYGDAMQLKKRPRSAFHKVLALESAQMFDDKKAFFEGARHVLKPGGSLCIAEPIPNHEFVYQPGASVKIEREILQGVEMTRLDLDNLRKKIKLYLQNLENIVKTRLNWSVLYGQYLEMLAKEGFRVEETQDISDEVLGRFPTGRAGGKLMETIERYPPTHPMTDILITLLISTYYLKQAFRDGLLGFYLIRAERGKGRK
ncbi:MAG: class I SAM-dependent methyltransferase [bacterium]